MKSIARICVAFIAPFAFMGAANMNRLPPDTKIRTIGIISALGNTFMFEETRPSAFEWLEPARAAFLEISDWGIDELVTQKVTSAAVLHHLVVKPVTFEPADFATWTYDDLARHINDFPDPDPDIDAYVVILRDWQADPIGRSDHQIAGLGIYRRDGAKGRLGIFAAWRIVVLDARDGRVIASRAAALPDGSAPWMPAGPSLWPKTQDDLTDAQRATLEADVKQLVDKSLLPTLRLMKLAD